jgi:hypothetical protein
MMPSERAVSGTLLLRQIVLVAPGISTEIPASGLLLAPSIYRSLSLLNSRVTQDPVYTELLCLKVFTYQFTYFLD